jgi:hypothetical protein
MREMRSTVAEFNIYRWAGEMIRDAARVAMNAAMTHPRSAVAAAMRA